MTTTYQGDPYWTTARFPGKCHDCGRPIRQGDRIYYYPKGKHILCADPCGKDAHREFVDAAEAEDRGWA